MAPEPSELGSQAPPPGKSSQQEPSKDKNQISKAGGKEKAADSAAASKVNAAEEKKRKKAEKAAKRAQEKATREIGGSSQAGSSSQGRRPSAAASNRPQNIQGGTRQIQASRPAPDQRGRQNIPARGGENQNESQQSARPAKEKKKTKDSHPFGDFAPRKAPHVADAVKEVHPAILALGFQMSHYVVCGSTARSIAMLQAFRALIDAYTTPPGTSFARHFTQNHLAKQIDFLVSCRPLAIPMGNSIRWLKDIVIREDPSKSESDTKRDLNRSINEFVQERFTAASTIIAQTTAAERIHPGDTVVTFGGSSVVKESLLYAHSEKIPFSVYCVDSDPLREGSKLALALQSAGIKVTIARINSLTRLMRRANVVLVGATAMTGNGALYARAGTAAVATIASYYKVPVIVLCQTIKFTDKPVIHGLQMNENAPGDELVGGQQPTLDSFDPQTGGLIRVDKWSQWKEKDGVHVLNLLYDLTPAEFIQGVICEHATIPHSAVPAMLRLTGGPAQDS